MLIVLAACTPAKDPPPATVNVVAQLMLVAQTQSVSPGAEVQILARYTGTDGARTNVVPALTSLNPTLAEVTTAGMVRAIAPGTARILATYQGVSDTAVLNIVADSSALARLYLKPDSIELSVGQSANLALEGRSLRGDLLSLGAHSWSLTNTSTGSLVGTTYEARAWGTTRATATINGVVSNPIEIAVIRSGSFYGAENHFGSGSGSLKEKNGQLFIRLGSNFISQSVPDARVYLSNSEVGPAVRNNGIEIALLRNTRGAQTYAVPAGVSIGQYRYLVIYCKQFSQSVVVTPLN